VLRPELIIVGEALLALEAEKLSLDQVAEAIGTARVTPDEIDELIYWLEMHGRPIADPIGKGAAALLREVLAAARTLRTELGRPPQPREIAERGGLSLEAVQRALWFARILQR
jgi:sigma-70-like protein